MRGIESIVSNDHIDLPATRRTVLSGATWQRCRSPGKMIHWIVF